MKRNKILQWFLALLLTTAMTLAYAPMAASWFAYADAGDTPAHLKTSMPNKTDDGKDDGTYKLELSVTGDADNETQETGGVNVVVVYDLSQSMTSNAGSSRYSRADQAEDIMHDFLTNLATYQNAAKDNIRVSLVTFGVTATQTSGWSTDVTGMANRFDDGGTDGTTRFTYNSYGTNWEHALQRAQTLVNGVTNDDPIFVIMLTDGAPTADGTTGNNPIAPTGATIQQLRQRYNPATDESYAIANAVEATGGTFYGIYAYGTEADLLDDLMYYSENGQHRGGSINNVVAATQDAPNYFNASETSQLQAAIDEIFDKVVQAMGVSSVAISDGTTHDVTTSTGTLDLLEVDEDSYQYWISIPVVGGKFTRVDRNGNTIEYTVTDNGDGTCRVSWTQGGIAQNVTVNGSVSGGQLKYEWTEKNNLYNYDPPKAKLTGNTVDWDLSSVGTLLDGVTYSVTFDVYPSQTTLDYIADIKNGKYDELPADVKQYINENGKLQTNTTATLTWEDTRPDATGGSVKYDNPDPVSSSAVEQLAIAKVWENELDSQAAKPITLKVLRDGDPHYDVPLTQSTTDPKKWEGSTFISIGIMGKDDTGNYAPLEGAAGHDFTFAEPEDISYHWELDIPTVHPMMIDGETTMLIKVDAKHPAPTGATTYTINGATYYADDETVALTATNHRRSSINLTKVVDGENAPAEAIFPFTLHVENSLAPETKPSESEDPNHESDWWIWVSVRDKDGNPVNDANVSGLTPSGKNDGWYYGETDTDLALNVKAGYSIRINNLPTGSEYSITEGDTPTGFIFEKAETTVKTGSEDPSAPVAGGRTTEGSIDLTNSLYSVTYTNEYALVDVTATKVWNDGSNQDGIRPETLSLTLNGLPTGTTAPTPTVTPSADGNSWAYTWAGVPKYDSEGEVITYTVTEGTVPEGYTCETTTVNAGGTITNVHNPATTDVTVTKAWDDDSNRDNVRPSDLALTLKANGTDVTSTYADKLAVTKDGDTWTYTWTGLPEKASGQAIAYTVTEGTVPTGYTCETATVDAGGTITNVHNPATTDVEVTKAWDDDSNRDNVRPSDLALTLKANGTDVTSTYEDKLSVTKNDNTWTYKWTGLPEKDNGQTITYTVTEGTVPDGYTCETTTVDAGGTITNKHTPEKVTVTVTKVWADQDDKDKLRPSELKLTLNPSSSVSPTVKKDGNTWTYTWSGLPKKAGGVDIEYTVSEENVPAGYTKSPADPVKDGGKITNKHTSTEALIVGLKELKGYDGSIPTGKFKFTIKGVSAEYDEGEQAPDEQPAEENAAKSSENEAAEQTSDTAAEPEAAKPAEEEASKEADAAAEKAEEAGKEAQEAQDNADLAKVEAEEAKNAAAEAAEQGAPEANQLQKAADEAAEKAEETQKAADEAKADADKAQEAADEAKADAEKAQEAADETTADKTAEAKPAQDTAVKEAPASEEKKSLEAAKDVAKAVADAADIPLPKETTVTNNAEGTIEFGKIIYEKAGTYTYEITESGSMANVTNDPEKTKTVVVKVTQDEDGNLQATVEPSDETYKFTFTNTYTEPDPGTCFIDPPVKKVIEGNAPKTAETYTFKLEATASGNPMPAAANGASSMTVNITGEGEKEFGKIVYDKDDAGKTYYYTVREEAGDNSDCEYDDTIYTVSAYIYVDDDGKLQVKREYFKDGNATDVATFEFVNTYESEEPDKGTGVKTGDDSGIMGLLALMSASAAGLAALCVRRRREEQ